MACSPEAFKACLSRFRHSLSSETVGVFGAAIVRSKEVSLVGWHEALIPVRTHSAQASDTHRAYPPPEGPPVKHSQEAGICTSQVMQNAAHRKRPGNCSPRNLRIWLRPCGKLHEHCNSGAERSPLPAITESSQG